MHLEKTTISIGLPQPFRALHISDNHLAYADERDGERKMALAAERFQAFETGDCAATPCLKEQLDYARRENIPVLHTGDICDFVSYKNLELARDLFRDVDYFMATGNHEFSLYVGEAFEDEAYKMQSYNRVQYFFRNHLLFDSRVMGGINFVAVDNGYYRFDEGQLFRLKEEAKKGLPMVLMMHSPLHTPELFQWSLAAHGQDCAYLTGTPESMMDGYSEYRFRQQCPNQPTLDFIDYVNQEPLIKAILAGHVHKSHESLLPSGIPQIITGGGYKGIAREITFI